MHRQINPRTRAQIIQSGKQGFSGGVQKSLISSGSQAAAAEYAHKRSQFVLNEERSSWPSLAAIKKSALSEWTIPYVKGKIAELKKEHRQQLVNATKYQMYEENQVEMDEYLTFDGRINWIVDLSERLESLYRMERHLQLHQSHDFVSRLRYSHIMALKPLYEKLQQLLIAEERAKVQRARLFPKSSQAWREMDTRDAKLKVAKFLLEDKKKQDDIITQDPIWRESRAEVDTVVLEFKSNIMFAAEVTNFVKENQTTDPRRRLA